MCSDPLKEHQNIYNLMNTNESLDGKCNKNTMTAHQIRNYIALNLFLVIINSNPTVVQSWKYSMLNTSGLILRP